MAHSAVSDLGLHCLPISYKKDASLYELMFQYNLVNILEGDYLTNAKTVSVATNAKTVSVAMIKDTRM